MSDYRVTVTAGTHSWDVTSGDPGDYGLTDPVTITRSLPDVDLFPAQPNPAQATFSVIVPDAADLSDLEQGTTVAVHVYSPADAATPIESFHGRLTDASATPHPLGCVYTITCVDYLADLAEEEVTWVYSISNYFADELVDDIFDQLGLGYAYTEGPPAADVLVGPYFLYQGPPPLKSPDTDTEFPFLQLLERYLSQWSTYFLEDPRGLFRYVLDQNITDDALDPVTPYLLRPIFKGAPLDYTTTPDPAQATVIDGARVDSSASYTLNKRQAIRRVKILRPEDSTIVVEHPGTPKPTLRLETDLDDDNNAAELMAMLYLPDDVPRPRWTADTFIWRLDKDTPGAYLPGLAQGVAIAPVQASWNPLGYPWFTGRLTGYTLTVSGGRHTVSFTLRDTAS